MIKPHTVYRIIGTTGTFSGVTRDITTLTVTVRQITYYFNDDIRAVISENLSSFYSKWDILEDMGPNLAKGQRR